jgi:hypothetical protein
VVALHYKVVLTLRRLLRRHDNALDIGALHFDCRRAQYARIALRALLTGRISYGDTFGWVLNVQQSVLQFVLFRIEMA